MIILKDKEGITYDDIILVPQFNYIKSRNNVNLRTKFSRNIEIDIPIVSANMDTVTGYKMAAAMSKCGGIGVLNRNYNMEDHKKGIEEYGGDIKNPVLSIGTKDHFLYMIRDMIKSSMIKIYKAIVIDIAHAHSIHVVQAHEYIYALLRESKLEDSIDIIIGNIATKEAANYLSANLVVSGLKVGIGPGSLCTTRMVTGHGYPQLSAIIDTSESLQDVPIIADGGIRSSGDIVKALAAGASSVMIGNLLADTVEAIGDHFTIDGIEYKSYRGMASKEASTSEYHSVSPEGESMLIRSSNNTVSQVIDKLVYGIRSGLTYSGSDCISDFRQKAVFMKVSNSSYHEGTPHGTISNRK